MKDWFRDYNSNGIKCSVSCYIMKYGKFLLRKKKKKVKLSAKVDQCSGTNFLAYFLIVMLCTKQVQIIHVESSECFRIERSNFYSIDFHFMDTEHSTDWFGSIYITFAHGCGGQAVIILNLMVYWV